MSATSRVLTISGATVQVFPDASTACRHAADRIATTIREAVDARGKAVLGLATGGTPVGVYARLVALHKAGEVSFAKVSSYNLDEYYPIHPADPNSYRAYMHRHLFGEVDIAPNRAHVLDGTVPKAFVEMHTAEFERWIAADGGLDLQLLGIGRNGHIGFNEPRDDLSVDAALGLRTRLVDLHPVTVTDAARDFGDASRVIPQALTLGIAPILSARSIVLLALGSGKSDAVTRALTGPLTASLPASLLRSASERVLWILDEPAAKGLG